MKITKLSMVAAFLGLSATSALGADQAAYADKDEGSMGPLQDAHEGEVVFANEVIARKETDANKLVKKTTLGRPLYLRAYLPKSPAALFNQKGLRCDDSARALWFLARRPGAKDAAELYQMDMPNLFFELRSLTITDLDGKVIVPVVPDRPTDIDGDANPALLPFASLLAAMKPGDNPVEIELAVGCKAQGVTGRRLLTAAKGVVTLSVTKENISNGAKLYKARSGDKSTTGRLRPVLQKMLTSGAKVLDFAADRTNVDPLVEQSSGYRVIFRNADKTCTYSVGRWVEPYLGGGKYAAGKPDVTHTEYPLPCP